MNILMKKIHVEFQNKCQIEILEGGLKFLVTFYNTETGNEKFGNCSIKIDLFKYENEKKYLLEFIRRKGEIKEYYEHFLKIEEIIIKTYKI